MTQVLTGDVHAHFERSNVSQMPDKSEHKGWHNPLQGYYSQMPSLTSPWRDAEHVEQQQQQQHHTVGTQVVDLRMFQHEVQFAGMGSYGSNSGGLISPGITYQEEPNWTSDVEMVTPTTTGFPQDNVATDGYNMHCQPAQGHYADAMTPSPKTVHTQRSPQVQYTYQRTHQEVQRPGLSRSNTAPEPHQREHAPPFGQLPTLKRQGTSEDGEDEGYMPGCAEETKSTGRGRKRQRIPHTAVERRYRENLNAHLEKLRLAVPCLASRGSNGHHGEIVEGVKPSKCEVLNGAIEHIAALDKEVAGLRDDNALLRAKLEEIQGRRRLNSAYAALSTQRG